ncbi:MAG: alanine dehydrogenase [Bacteroidetes bacterium RIFCSPLOWO2_12_FULL_35_15]|nr:MAG: alanine dehydrogenase [Bacteroidetes bacterium RIFCSPLOWO2_12_FULL_35_15]
MKTSKELLAALTQTALMPQEEMLEVARKKGKLFIGIPKEISFQENRVPLVPDAVALLVNNGHTIVIESNAGKMAHFEDHDFSEAGATIVYSPEEVYKANIILKVAPPSPKEIEMMQQKQTLISALQLTVQPEDFLKQLISKKITAIAFDWIKDEDGIYTIIRSMGEIAGSTSILIAAEYLSNVNNGQGSILGGISGISPTEVIILGAGTVGEFATRAALGLGASVKVFDNSISRLRRMQSDLGRRIFTSTIQPRVLAKHLKTADVVIGAIRAQHGRTPCVVTEEMVAEMKTGSVIIDVSIDQGGCFETSEVTNHTNPVFRKHGVIHYCVPNIASRVSRTASYSLSTIFAQILIDIGEEGGVDYMLRRDEGVRNGVYLYNGTLTNRVLGKIFKLPYKDINLLMAGI